MKRTLARALRRMADRLDAPARAHARGSKLPTHVADAPTIESCPEPVAEAGAGPGRRVRSLPGRWGTYL